MGYTIVYDRRFIRCGDKYIPFCLYGSSNVTQFNSRTGREVLERQWNPFTYGDNMFLATADELMEEVRKHHDGSCNENFKYHGKWLDDSQVIKFFQNGIKDAVTVEEIKAGDFTSLHCYLTTYPADDIFKSTVRMESFIQTSHDLENWINKAKEEKKRLFDDKEIRSGFIEVSMYSSEPLKARQRKEIKEPCILRSSSKAYVRDISVGRVVYCNNVASAKVFADSDEAYLAADMLQIRGVTFSCVPLKRALETTKEKSYILSVQNANQRQRMFVGRLTSRRLFFELCKTGAKRFISEKEAIRWYQMHIEGRFKGISDPVVEKV